MSAVIRVVLKRHRLSFWLRFFMCAPDEPLHFFHMRLVLILNFKFRALPVQPPFPTHFGGRFLRRLPDQRALSVCADTHPAPLFPLFRGYVRCVRACVCVRTSYYTCGV